MPAGNRSSLRLPAGIVVSARTATLAVLLATAVPVAPAAAADDMNATIQGHARFQGTPPARPRITMTVDRTCDELNPKGRPADSLVVDGSGGIANVVVHVKSGLDPKLRHSPPAAAVSIGLRGCAFEPHVAALRVGQEIVVHNHDETLHTLHAKAGDNPSFDASLVGKDSEIRKALQRTGLGVKVRCNRHPWEGLFLSAFDDPYFAVTASDGSFSIPGLPEGEYTLEAWHESLGTRTAAVSVDEGGVATVDFPFAGN